ncbi:hypothetical protein L226DRAFT_573540 [Lentinus tigrinus ALCF2SS1-7]|uniref:Uncharacterized protein n=1 Tax=Lentinus tigrinus ALCF2SS1-6 TaxID=1328759 RepID=A0A5C2S4G0_9APHY|nr:hypothetical protein L227DRAFT_577752 [Lentinus tigrinus ALCF2SS1-6]RPD71864.1 hypothetical protein L226DRAFT_573540 [Lentinus tigrinus ALCF2SS1-7]
MYSVRIAKTFTLIFLSLAYLAAASPAPIDPQQANVIAESHNAACSGPQGCVGANGTVAVETTSGASRSVAVSSGALVAAVALAGLL